MDLVVFFSVFLLLIVAAVAISVRAGRPSESYVYEAVTTIFLWFLVVIFGDVSPPIQFMSVYTETQRREYYFMMAVLLEILFLYHVVAYFAFGGTLAKRLAGLRLVRADGTELRFRDSLKRAITTFGLWLLILAPGPIVGFAFGPGSETASLGLLLSALIVCLYLSTSRATENGSWYQSRLDHLLGMKCLHVKRLFPFSSRSSA